MERGFCVRLDYGACENNPEFFFTSITIPESATVSEALSAITLQEI